MKLMSMTMEQVVEAEPPPAFCRRFSSFLCPSHYARFAKESNPFDRMAILLQAVGIVPRPDGFETLLKKMGRKA